MEVTIDTINKIIELAKPEVIELGGSKYTTRPIYRNNKPCAESLYGFSLSAVVDYLKENPDGIKECLVEISSQDVNIVSPLNDDMCRNFYFESKPNLVSFSFGQFFDIESFKIMVMSRFVQDDNTAVLLKFVSSLCEKSENTLEDDGVTQKVAAMAGVATLATVEVPNPVMLRPLRTFYDIEQPESPFVFRITSGMQAALFEADGGAWIGKEVKAIKEYLSEHLKGVNNIKVCLLG